MNPIEYIGDIKTRLLSDRRVTFFIVRKEYSNQNEGHIRAKLTLANGDFLEFAERIEINTSGDVVITGYAYHWSTADGILIQRWDNTPHHPELEGFPHHIHRGETVEAGRAMNIFSVLDEIEQELKKSNAQ